jgi:hypothetical protein
MRPTAPTTYHYENPPLTHSSTPSGLLFPVPGGVGQAGGRRFPLLGSSTRRLQRSHTGCLETNNKQRLPDLFPAQFPRLCTHRALALSPHGGWFSENAFESSWKWLRKRAYRRHPQPASPDARLPHQHCLTFCTLQQLWRSTSIEYRHRRRYPTIIQTREALYPWTQILPSPTLASSDTNKASPYKHPTRKPESLLIGTRCLLIHPLVICAAPKLGRRIPL